VVVSVGKADCAIEVLESIACLVLLQGQYQRAAQVLDRIESLVEQNATRRVGIRVSTIVLRAALAHLQKDDSAAVSQLLKAIHIDPSNMELVHLLASLLITGSSRDRAANELEGVCRNLDSGNGLNNVASAVWRSSANAMLGISRLNPLAATCTPQQRRTEVVGLKRATATVQRAIARYPDAWSLWYLLGVVSYARAARRQRRSDFEATASVVATTLTLLRAVARSSELDRVLVNCLVLASDCQLQLGHTAEAVAHVAQALEAAGNRAELTCAALRQRARCHIASGSIKEALGSYREALALDARQIGVWLEMSDVYQRCGMAEAALECLTAPVRLESVSGVDKVACLVHQACFHLNQEQVSDALRCTIGAIKQSNKQSGVAFLLKGLVHARSREWKQALVALNVSFTLEPSQPLLNLLFGEVHLAQREFQQAESDALFAIDAATGAAGEEGEADEPRSVAELSRALMLLAELSREAGMLPRARVLAQQALHLDPTTAALESRCLSILQE